MDKKIEVLAKALMMLDSPVEWENVAAPYREAWRGKARLVEDSIAKSGFKITND